jgi:NAD+ kinase
VGMINAVGLVLHPGRDCTTAAKTITDWSRAREVAVLGLEDEIVRIGAPAAAVEQRDLARRSDVLVSASVVTVRCCARCALRAATTPRCSG